MPKNFRIFITEIAKKTDVVFLLERFSGHDFSQKNINIFLANDSNITHEFLHKKSNEFFINMRVKNGDFAEKIHEIDMIFMPTLKQKILAKKHGVLYFSHEKSLIYSVLRILRNVAINACDFTCEAMFRIYEIFAKKRAQNTQNSVAIIRVDGIGDYILFRDFISILHKKYKNITLIYNQQYGDLIDIDRKYICEAIAVNKNKYMNDIFYRFNFVFTLKKRRYDLLLNPVYSRDMISETIAKNMRAKVKIAQTGDKSNMNFYALKKYDHQYNFLIKSDEKLLFEFDRNRDFCAQILKIDLKMGLKSIAERYEQKHHEKYMIFFIGGSSESKKWSKYFYLQIAQNLAKYRMKIKICGDENDIINGNFLAQSIGKTAENLCGKTTLNELIFLISGAQFLLTNETSAGHIAAALQTSVFVLCAGQHIGRFVPYPKNFTTHKSIFHPLIFKNFARYSFFSNHLSTRLKIDAITPEKVLKIIKSSQILERL